MIVPCYFCGEPVDTVQIGNYRKGTGWVENRGAQGGAHALRLPEPHDEWAHPRCIDLEAQGIGVGQEALEL